MLLAAGISGATGAPVGVSPGAPQEFEEIVGRCPTFSWGG